MGQCEGCELVRSLGGGLEGWGIGVGASTHHQVIRVPWGQQVSAPKTHGCHPGSFPWVWPGSPEPGMKVQASEGNLQPPPPRSHILWESCSQEPQLIKKCFHSRGR